MNALWLALFAVAAGDTTPTVRPEAPPIDCGPSALYLLLRIEGLEADLSDLARSLPPQPDSGTSMKELREEATGRGLRLRGVRLRPGERLEGPSIAFMSDGAHGHFIVVRPVGHSGNLVQVLDPNEMPIVLECEALDSLPRWTGLALVRETPNWPTRAAVLLTILTGLSFILKGVLKSLRCRLRPGHALQDLPRSTIRPTG